jgi:hypothetical protein
MSVAAHPPAARPKLDRAARACGLAGATLGTLAGVVELAFGPSIRSWVGDKHDTTRLGVVTVLLGLVALAAAIGVARCWGTAPLRRLALGAGLTLPGLVGFTTVGQLWYLPGALLLAAGGLAARELSNDARAIAVAAERTWSRVLIGVLGALTLALGLASHGWAATLGIGGGLVVIAIAVSGRPARRGARVLALAVAGVPFAVATWWSIVTPWLAVLTVALGAATSSGWAGRRAGTTCEQPRPGPRRTPWASHRPPHEPRSHPTTASAVGTATNPSPGTRSSSGSSTRPTTGSRR